MRVLCRQFLGLLQTFRRQRLDMLGERDVIKLSQLILIEDTN